MTSIAVFVVIKSGFFYLLRLGIPDFAVDDGSVAPHVSYIIRGGVHPFSCCRPKIDWSGRHTLVIRTRNDTRKRGGQRFLAELRLAIPLEKWWSLLLEHELRKVLQSEVKESAYFLSNQSPTRQEIFASAPMISSRGAIAINSTFQITNIAGLCIAAYI